MDRLVGVLKAVVDSRPRKMAHLMAAIVRKCSTSDVSWIEMAEMGRTSGDLHGSRCLLI
jgi:stage V sporulation protein SpoVS